MWTARRHQKQCSCTAICLPVHSHGGFHPQFVTTTFMEKKERGGEKKESSWGFVLLSGSVLVVGGAESFQNGNWVNVKRPKATSDLLDCISAKEIRLCSSVFIFPTWNLPPTAGATVAPPGKLWFSAKSIQCCIVQVLHSALKKHAYRDWVGSTLSYSTILICAEFGVCRQQDGPVPGICLRRLEGHPAPRHNRGIYFRRLICISLKRWHFLSQLESHVTLFESL